LEVARQKEEMLANFAMGKARDNAWTFSQALASTPRSNWASLIAKRDDSTVELGRVLSHRGLLASFLHAKESRDVAKNIEALATGEFDFGHRRAE
jgi:hypothetical protein